jgi:hypothetical protein
VGLKDRLQRLEGRVGPSGKSDAYYTARKRITSALDRVALLRVRQEVAAVELVLESEEDRATWSVFEVLAERLGDGA